MRSRRSRDVRHEDEAASHDDRCSNTEASVARRVAEVKRRGARPIALGANEQLRRERRLRQGACRDEATRLATMRTRSRAECGATDHVAMGLSRRHGDVTTVRTTAVRGIAMVPADDAEIGPSAEVHCRIVDGVARSGELRTFHRRRPTWGVSAFRLERQVRQSSAGWGVAEGAGTRRIVVPIFAVLSAMAVMVIRGYVTQGTAYTPTRTETPIQIRIRSLTMTPTLITRWSRTVARAPTTLSTLVWWLSVTEVARRRRSGREERS